MQLAERDAFHTALKGYQAGDLKDSMIMQGGDLCPYSSTPEQQDVLLKLTEIAVRTVSCSLPITAVALKGVIFEIPVPDREEEILAALKDQGVIHVKRLPIKGRPDVPPETIILTFVSKLPYRLKIETMSFQVKQSVPTLYQCKKCWRLGQTTSSCSLDSACCKNCGIPHPTENPYATRCINCSFLSHAADSDTCPEFFKMKAVLKTAFIQGITIKEARSQYTLNLFIKVILNQRGNLRRMATSPGIATSASKSSINKIAKTFLDLFDT